MKINKIILSVLTFAALNSSQCNSVTEKQILTGFMVVYGISIVHTSYVTAESISNAPDEKHAIFHTKQLVKNFICSSAVLYGLYLIRKHVLTQKG